MSLQSIKYDRGTLEILDQLLLPLEYKYVKITSVYDGWLAIHSMQVRGAPAIAIVGCLSVAVELYLNQFQTKEDLQTEVESKLKYLVTARPTAVNLDKEAFKLISYSKQLLSDPAIKVESMKTSLIEAIEKLLVNDISDNKAIGKFGAEAILSGRTLSSPCIVLTHCNTGSLATAGYGTALGVIRHLFETNTLDHVYCTETRPYMQGARLTAYELVHEHIPCTLICDSAVAALLKSQQVSAVVVGADRVAANGDTANKIGTYQIGLLAKAHGVPFYVCAPFSSIDFTIESGNDIIIEERPTKEMTEILEKRIAAPGIKCWNPAFDVTPASLIAGIVTEKGVFAPEVLKTHAQSVICLKSLEDNNIFPEEEFSVSF